MTTPTDRALAQAFRSRSAADLQYMGHRHPELQRIWEQACQIDRAAEIDASKPEPAEPPLGDHTAVCPGCGLGFACGSKPITSESGPLIHQSASTPADAEAVETLSDQKTARVALPNKHGFEQWYVENAFDYERNPIGSLECSIARKAWHDALAARPAAVDGDAVEVEAVAILRKDDDGSHLEWLLEGECSDMVDGDVLCVLSEQRLTEATGHVTLYTQPQQLAVTEYVSVAEVEGADEYGPRLIWNKHWVDCIGMKLYVEVKK